jgi:hypothetical protein
LILSVDAVAKWIPAFAGMTMILEFLPKFPKANIRFPSPLSPLAGDKTGWAVRNRAVGPGIRKDDA